MYSLGSRPSRTVEATTGRESDRQEAQGVWYRPLTDRNDGVLSALDAQAKCIGTYLGILQRNERVDMNYRYDECASDGL